MVLRKLGLSSKICADNKAEIRFDRAVNSVHPGYFLVFMLGLAPALAAATYEVAQQDSAADDKGPGTAKQPWKTISRAAEKVGPGDVVIIRSGTYHERVHVKASGTAESPIRIEAARALRKIAGSTEANVAARLPAVQDDQRAGIAWAVSRSGRVKVEDLLPLLVDDDARRWVAYILGTQDQRTCISQIEQLRLRDPEVYFAVTVLWKILASWVYDLEDY